MKKLEIRSKTRKAALLSMSNKIYEGWKVTRAPRKNWLGVYVCKLEKKDNLINIYCENCDKELKSAGSNFCGKCIDEGIHEKTN